MEYKIIAGRSNIELAQKVAEILGKNLLPVTAKNFNDGEIYFQAGDSVRGSHVFVIQSTSNPVNDNLIELCLMIDALKRASAEKITAIIPYYGYARQDRKAAPREPISAKLVSSLIERAGANKIISFDLHADQIQGYFDIPLDNLAAMPVIAQYILDKKFKNMIVVTPDVGGATRARRFAEAMSVELAIIDKRRSAHGKSKIMNLIGEVEGKVAILVDDIIDTGGTIANAAKELKAKGAEKVIICATHGVLSNDAVDNLNCDEIDEVVLTDSIMIPKEKIIKNGKIKIVSIAPYIAASIECETERRSMDKVVDGYYSELLEK